MATRNFSSSAAQTSLAAGISGANTSIQVVSTTGFPAAPFILALDAGASAQELVLVTAVAGTTLTVTRGYDSTVATTHDAGAVVQHSHAALDFREANSHVNANSGVHGLTGSVVGTSDAQTLSNKTLALGGNTVSGTKAQFNTAVTDGNPVWDNEVGLFGTWTPTVTASSGTFTTVSGTGRYTQIGKAVTWSATITITTVGTASTYVHFTLPVTAQAAVGYIGGGRTNAGMQAQVSLNSATVARVSRYDDASVIAAGALLLLSGTYEAA